EVDLSAKEIHAMGLEQLARVKAEMEEVLARVVPEVAPGEPIAAIRAIAARPDQKAPQGDAFFDLARSFVKTAQETVARIWGADAATLDPMLVDATPNTTDPVASYLRSPPGSTIPARIFFNPAAETPVMDMAYVTFHEYTHHLQFTSKNLHAE